MSGYSSIRKPSTTNVGDRHVEIYQFDVPKMSSPCTPFNTLLNNRDRIVELPGKGSFNNIFLAMDEQDSTSLYVIKQRSPSNAPSPPKASELFYQESTKQPSPAQLSTDTTPPVEPKLASFSKTSLKPPSRERQFLKPATRDAVGLVLGLMFLFILTCTGSMALIGVLFEMEQQSSTLQPEQKVALITRNIR